MPDPRPYMLGVAIGAVVFLASAGVVALATGGCL